MERQGRDLKLRMQGPDVLQLQTALRQLGATITDRDGFFGKATRKAVMDVQAAHGLPATGTVDATFRQRLTAVLAPTPAPTPSTLPTPSSAPPPKQPSPVPLGNILPQASDGNAPYVVEGEVVQPDGTPLQDYPVRAFDRALGDWRLLGEARTNEGGRYSISYEPEQLKAWGKTRADLKVEAYDAATSKTVLAMSPLILQALQLETVNFAIGTERYRGPDEYTRVETALALHLQSLPDLNRLEVADVLILARQTKLVNSSVAYYVKAQRWAAEFKAPAALFYGLLRRHQPTHVDALLARPLARLWAALEEAKAQNIIKLPLTDALRTQLGDIQQQYLMQPEHPYMRLLHTTTLSTAQQAVFTQRLIARDVIDNDFWQSLTSRHGFSDEQVTDLRAAFALQAFTDDNTPLTIHLRSALHVRAPREVAALSVEVWRDTALTGAGVDIPAEILPGEPEPERRAAYAQMLYRSAELRYPTASLAGQMERNPDWAGQPVLVPAFFKAYPDFEFRDKRITYFLQENPEALDLFLDAQAGKSELLRVEQLFHLTPSQDKLAVMQPLWQADLRSAPQIAMLGRQKLLRLPGGLDQQVANGIYRQAVHITSVALNIYVRYHPQLNRLSPSAVRTPQLPREQALARAATTLPEWEELFGSTDACACSPYESALSPAAYLVDCMAFLQRVVAEGDPERNALDELLYRRPDLGTLQLTSENTVTELPHIDLQTEIMEAIVVSEDPETFPGNAIGPITWDSAHLYAQPEYLNPKAYEKLREAEYPFDLPFDLWLEEGRRYLTQMGIARDELMRVEEVSIPL